MKRKFLIGSIVFACVSFILSCNSNAGHSEGTVVSPAKTEFPKGLEVYNANCKVCHQENGQGVSGTFPPLAQSDYLAADKVRAIRQVLKGSSGEITVNGVSYNGTMPPQVLSDEQIAEVLNYVYHSWGNKGEVITQEEVRSLR